VPFWHPVERCPLRLLCRLHRGFTRGTDFTSEDDEKLAELVDAQLADDLLGRVPLLSHL
jgi:hypothetical protein